MVAISESPSMGPLKQPPYRKFTGLKPKWHHNIKPTKYHAAVILLTGYTFPENYLKKEPK